MGTTPTKGPADHLDLGDWNAQCFMCGRKEKASRLVKNWQGQYVCSWHVGIQRQPQDFVRGIPDNQAAPWVQKSPDNYIDVCFPNDQSAIPDYAIPDCVKPDYIAPGNTIF